MLSVLAYFPTSLMTLSPERLEELQSIPDSEIDLSESPELDVEFLERSQDCQTNN